MPARPASRSSLIVYYQIAWVYAIGCAKIAISVGVRCGQAGRREGQRCGSQALIARVRCTQGGAAVRPPLGLPVERQSTFLPRSESAALRGGRGIPGRLRRCAVPGAPEVLGREPPSVCSRRLPGGASPGFAAGCACVQDADTFFRMMKPQNDTRRADGLSLKQTRMLRLWLTTLWRSFSC